MEKKGLIIAGIIILILIGLGIYHYSTCCPTEVISPKEITPSQAYQVCNASSCINDVVMIEGEMRTGFTLSDKNQTIFIKLTEDASFLDKLKTLEENHLLGDGVVRVKVFGNLYHEVGMCDMGGCRDMVFIVAYPEEIIFIEEVGLKGEKEGRYIPRLEDPFDMSVFKLLASEAYEKIVGSDCLSEGIKTTGYFDYSFEEDYWRFQLSDPNRPGGCTDFCHVSKDNVEFKRFCAGY